MSNEELRQNAILSKRLPWFGKVDAAVYQVEVVIVVFALIAMSVAVFIDIVFQTTAGFQQAINRGESMVWLTIPAILAFIGMMAFTATGAAATKARRDQRMAEGDGDGSSDNDPLPEYPSLAFRLGVSFGVVAMIVGTAVSMLHFDSSLIYRILVAAMIVPVAKLYWERGQIRHVAILSVTSLIGLVMLGKLPSGYSWAQSYGLFLLLWVGFIGASIAARERRHLRVDLTRKLLATKWVPHFNALSYFVAALFTGVVFYLGFVYLFGLDSSYMGPIWEPPTWLPASIQAELKVFPLAEDASVFRRMLQVFFGQSQPGEIPDWLKVLSIPVSMALICIRFLAHALVFGMMAARGEKFQEFGAVH